MRKSISVRLTALLSGALLAMNMCMTAITSYAAEEVQNEIMISDSNEETVNGDETEADTGDDAASYLITEPISATTTTLPDVMNTVTTTVQTTADPSGTTETTSVEKKFSVSVNVLDADTGEHLEGIEVGLFIYIGGGWMNTENFFTEGQTYATEERTVRIAPGGSVRYTVNIMSKPSSYSIYGSVPENREIIIDENSSDVMECTIYLKNSYTTAVITGTRTATTTTTTTADQPAFSSTEVTTATIATTGMTSPVGTTTTTANDGELRACEGCGKEIYRSEGIVTPLGMFLCTDCRASGMGGTLPHTGTETTQTTTTTTTAFIDTSGAETSTTTAVFCYATMLEYDDSNMTVGETRAIRFYHPETLTATDAQISEVSGNISYTYETGSDTVYITALEPGEVKMYIRVSDCAFGSYVYINVDASEGTQTTNSTTTTKTESAEATTTAATTTMLITTTESVEETLPQTGYSGSYKMIIGLAAFMTVAGTAVVVRTKKKTDEND